MAEEQKEGKNNRICLPRQQTWVQPLGWEDPLEKEMATHASVLAWEIPWTKEPGGLQSMGSQRVRHDLVTQQHYKKKKSVTLDTHMEQLVNIFSMSSIDK